MRDPAQTKIIYLYHLYLRPQLQSLLPSLWKIQSWNSFALPFLLFSNKFMWADVLLYYFATLTERKRAKYVWHKHFIRDQTSVCSCIYCRILVVDVFVQIFYSGLNWSFFVLLTSFDFYIHLFLFFSLLFIYFVPYF